MPSPLRPCSHPGCYRAVAGRGLCSLHLQRQARGRALDGPPKRTGGARVRADARPEPPDVVVAGVRHTVLTPDDCAYLRRVRAARPRRCERSDGCDGGDSSSAAA